jgi:hypothetical protein
LTYESETPFTTCEDVDGNKNVCLRYTGKNNCKWDSGLLKCVTITDDELQ